MPPFLRPALFVALIAAPAQALDFAFPGPSQETAAATETGTEYALPVGPWDGETFLSRRIEGTVERRAFRIDGPQSTVSLMSALRTQVQADGWRILYECDAPVCGGFDFRFATVILPEPDMHVDLGDFRVLSADKGDVALNLIVSRSPRAGFVQVTRVTPGAPPPARPAPEPLPQAEMPVLPDGLEVPQPAPATAPTDGPATTPPGDLLSALQSQGHIVLSGLRFASGASTLEQGDYPELAILADWLRADPTRRIALVGHTDASGGLESNITLSRRRAASVRAELINVFGVTPAQIEAEGVGYLAPLAPNLTEEGRQANRRVEAVLLSPGG